MAVTVHTMGVHYRWTDHLPPQLRRQLRLAHDLREDLVTIQVGYEQAVKDIWSSYPAVAAAEAALTAAERAAEQAAEAVSAEGTRHRAKRVTGPSAAVLAAAKRTVREARQTRRDAIAAVNDKAQRQLAAAREELVAAQKALYAKYCQGDGDLFWATFNDVLDHHRTAVKRIAQQRAQGRLAQLRRHRFDGTGSIAVQLQRQSGMPPRTPELIADSTARYGRVLHLPLWVDPEQWETLPRGKRLRDGRVTVRMRAGSHDGAPAWLDIPVQQHRMLAADADISGARLVVTRVAGTLRATLSVTAKIPDPQRGGDGPDIAVHLGVRSTGSGVRVGRWRATAPIDVPFDFRRTLTVDPGRRSGEILIPRSVPRRIERARQIRGHRDIRLDELRDLLTTWLSEHGPVAHPTRDGESLTAVDVRQAWKYPNRFAALARSWRDDQTVPTEVREALTAWRDQDWISWHHQEGARRRATGHRLDIYRQIAAVLVGQAGRIIVDDTRYADIARPSAATGTEDLPSDTAAAINRHRAHGAPGELRNTLVTCAARDGVTVTVVPHDDTSLVHASCGHRNPPDGRFTSTLVTCAGCGNVYDQDESALTHMLTRAKEDTSP